MKFQKMDSINNLNLEIIETKNNESGIKISTSFIQAAQYLSSLIKIISVRYLGNSDLWSEAMKNTPKPRISERKTQDIEVKEEKMFCPFCGKQINRISKFCSYCGKTNSYNKS